MNICCVSSSLADKKTKNSYKNQTSFSLYPIKSIKNALIQRDKINNDKKQKKSKGPK